MAEMAGLYFGMGIDTSQLNSDFVNAEKTINQNLKRINQEMSMIQLRGQLEIEGLDESATQLEKVRIQEENLTAQMDLQQDKILLLTKTYEHLINTRGENAEATRQVELALTREQYAMQKLETQMESLENQTKTVFDVNTEILTLTEPVMKKIAQMEAAGAALPLGLAPPQAKVAAGALIALAAAIKGTSDATEELREKNPARLIDEDTQRFAGSIDNSWQKINESNRRGMEQMRSYNRAYYDGERRYNQTYKNFSGEQDKQIQETKERTEQLKEIKSQTEQIGEIKKEQDGLLKRFAKAIGVKEEDGELNVLPDLNRNDILRFSKVMEEYRFSESLSQAMDLWHDSSSVIGKIASALVTLNFLSSNAQVPITEFTETAIENFRELAQAAAELNLPLEKTNDILAKIKLAGGEYNDVRDYVRGVQDAVIKGDSEDPEVLALEKYGVVIQDTNGKLLAFDETLERLYQGYLKAREAGEAEGYVMMTNGQSVHDVLPYFEKLAQAEEDFAKIKWSTLDPATMRNVSREMKMVETQTAELANAISSMLAPAAEIAFEQMFEDQKKLTERIEENRETVIYWTYALMEAIKVAREIRKVFSDTSADVSGAVQEKILSLRESFFADEPKKDINEEAKEYFIPFYEALKKLDEEFNVIKKLESFLPEGFTQELDTATSAYLVPFYENIKSIKEELSLTNKIKNAVSDFLPDILFSEEDSIFARAQKDLEEYKKANEEARKETEKANEKIKNYLDGLSYSKNRVRTYKEELAGLNLDIEFGSGDSYQKKIEQNKIWYEKAMADAKQYADEIAIIDELNAAKELQIEQEKEEKLAEIRERIAAADKSTLENKLAEIEKEKAAWLDMGMEEAEAEQLAEKQKADYIRGVEEELAKSITAIHQTEFEKRLTQIEEEKQAWLDKGASEVQAEEFAQAQIQQLLEDKAKKEQSERKQKEKAERDYQKSLKQAWEQYYQQVQAAQEEADRKNKALRDEALNAVKAEAEEFTAYLSGGYEALRKLKYDKLIESGVNPELLKKMTSGKFEEYKAAKEEAERSLLPNWSDPYSPKHVEKPNIESPDFSEAEKATDTLAQSFDSVSAAADNLTQSLNQLVNGNISVGEQALPVNYNSGDGAVAMYQNPDGSIAVKNYYSDMKYNEPLISTPYSDNEIESQNFDSLTEATQSATTALNELPTAIQGISENLSVAENFSGMNTGFAEVTVRLSDLSQALANFTLPTQNQSAEQRQPVNVNTSVQIEEAHAWDYNHIQELADRVANILEPRIISAIGGDSNSY